VFSDEVTKQLDLKLDTTSQRWLIVREFVVANGKRASEQRYWHRKSPVSIWMVSSKNWVLTITYCVI